MTNIALDSREKWNPVHKLLLAGEVLVTYAHVRLLLHRHALPIVVRRIREAESTAGAADRALGFRLARATVLVLRRLPTDTRCLMQSLVLADMLHRRGLTARLVVAAQTNDGFSAHAWVEHRGEPLLPPGDERYGRLVEL